MANWWTREFKFFSGIAKMAVYFVLQSQFAQSYDFPHDYSDDGVLNVLGGVLLK